MATIGTINPLRYRRTYIDDLASTPPFPLHPPWAAPCSFNNGSLLHVTSLAYTTEGGEGLRGQGGREGFRLDVNSTTLLKFKPGPRTVDWVEAFREGRSVTWKHASGCTHLPQPSAIAPCPLSLLRLQVSRIPSYYFPAATAIIPPQLQRQTHPTLRDAHIQYDSAQQTPNGLVRPNERRKKKNETRNAREKKKTYKTGQCDLYKCAAKPIKKP